MDKWASLRLFLFVLPVSGLRQLWVVRKVLCVAACFAYSVQTTCTVFWAVSSTFSSVVNPVYGIDFTSYKACVVLMMILHKKRK